MSCFNPENENIASGELLDLMRRAKCFGINLARLDIRQESSRHSQLISEFVKKKYNKDYLKMSESEKILFLKSRLLTKKNSINKFKFQNMPRGRAGCPLPNFDFF